MKKTNKIISILLVLAMLMSVAPLTAFAATEAYQLIRDDYSECAYSENVTQYYRDNNYLYKATYSNLKNVAKVGICFNYSYDLRLHYISSDGENSGYVILYKAIKEVAKASDLPKSPGATLSCMSYYEKLYINKDKPVVTFTCLAVNAPVWTWNGTSSATAKFTSTDGKATMTVDATIESSVQPAANCLEKDKTVYTATATANGKAYTNEKTIYGEQGSHSFEYSGDDVIGRCTNGCGYECPHENQTGEICTICGGLTHKHSFVYTANGNVITATCSNTDGYCNETNGGTLTISAPADIYTDGTISREAVIDNQLVEAADYTVTYSTADGSAPKTAGTYTASVTIGGAIATVEFTLSNYAAKVTDKDGNEIEGSPYKTFAEAVTAASASEGSTLTLLDDITVTTFQIINSGNFTIDLNGKTLLSESSFALRIQSGAHVTIKDSGEGGTVESKATGASAVINYGELTVESGTMKGDGGIDNRGFLNFIGGTAEGVTYSAIKSCGSAGVYGGVMKSENGNGITNDSGGVLYVYGGKISGCSGIANYDTAFLSGGEFKGNSYAAINLISGTVEITGGSFTGMDDEYGSLSGTPYSESTVDYTEGANLTLKGGEFPNGFTVHNTTSNSLLAEGYAFYNKDGNKITVADDAQKIDSYVQVKEHYIARVTDKDGNLVGDYKTLADAVTAAQVNNESTIVLLDDITVDETVEITSGKFTLDVNGKTLLLNNSANIYVGVEGGDVDAANVTFTDTAGGGKITGFRLIYNYATAEITGNISLITDNYSVYNYGEMIISGNAYIYGRCAVNNENLLTVNGGTVESENEGIYNGKELIINNGNINGSYGIWNVDSGTAEIYGGNIKGTEFAVICDGKTEIYGGAFVSETTETFAVNKQSYENSDLTVYGDEFPDGISVIGTTMNDLLADGYYFRDADGKIITVAENSTGIDGYVKVTKGADFSVDAVITAENVVYNGAAQEPIVTVTVGSKTLTEGKDYTLTFANNINAGMATVTVTGAGDYEGEIVKTFEIAKADSSIDVYPEANKLTYNGEAQALVTAGSSESGTVVYSLDGAEYSETIPTGTNAGEYTVYYKVIGDKNHNDTEAETVIAAIEKKPVTVSATVPDRIYGDDYQVDTSKVVVTFDGIVDGDDVGYAVIDAYYHMHTVTDSAPVQVVYNVNGADAGNYQFPEYGDWMAPNYGVQATGKVLPRDIADAQITLGDVLIYNGAEQTQSIASVTVDGFDVTYDVSGNTATNAGTYELTITGNGNFTGTKTALFTITPKDISGGEVVLGDALKYIGYEQVMTVESVTVDGMDVTYTASGYIATNVGIYPLTVTGTGNFCGEITVLYEIEVDTSAIDGINTSNVKSTDIVTIEYFLYQLDNAVTDYADEDKLAEWDELRAYCNELLAKEKEITEEYKRIILAVRSYDESTVKSADKDALIQLNKDIYALALTDNLTEQKTQGLEEAHDKILVLLDKITVISDELKRIIEEVDKYVFESVKSTDKADIQQLIADIKALLDTQNLTADERTLLETEDETCDKLVAKIDETVAEINRINEATNVYDESTVTSADKEAIEQLIADIKALTDGDNITDAEREQLNGNDAVLDALLAKINATAEEIERIEETVNGYDEATVKSTDKADLEQLRADIKALTDTNNITEDERAKLGNLDATLDSLIKKIDDTAAEIARIDEAVNGYNAETVTSADIPAIGKLIDDIKALTDGGNLTDDEKAALEANDEAIDELVAKLTEVAEEIKSVDEAVKSYDEATVKSTDSENLEQLKEDIQALIDSTNTTENEKTAFAEILGKVDTLLNKIAETEKKLEEIKGIENNFNPENVSSDDKAAIEEKIAEIENVNPDNLTEEQKAEYDEIKAGFEALLDKISFATLQVDAIGETLEALDADRATIFWEEDIGTVKSKIDELLADENMGEAEKARLNEYKAQCDEIIGIINTPAKYFSMRFFYLVWDAVNWIVNRIASVF